MNSSIKIKKLEENDTEVFIEMLALFADVFEMESIPTPHSRYLSDLLRRDNFQVFVALQDLKVVGGLTSYVLNQYYSEKPLAYIYDLAVDRNYQRQGIGLKLMAYVNKYYKQKGFEEVFVQADKIDDYAIDFYRKTNPSGEDPIVHFHYKLENA